MQKKKSSGTGPTHLCLRSKAFRVLGPVLRNHDDHQYPRPHHEGILHLFLSREIRGMPVAKGTLCRSLLWHSTHLPLQHVHVSLCAAR